MDFGEVEDPVGLACPPLDFFFGIGDLESDSCLSGFGDLDGFFEDDGNVTIPSALNQRFDPLRDIDKLESPSPIQARPKIIIRHRHGNNGKGKVFVDPEINSAIVESDKVESPRPSPRNDIDKEMMKRPKIVIIKHRYGNGGKGKVFPEIKSMKMESEINTISCSIGQEIVDYNSKLEASKRKLHESYAAADRAKKQRVIKVIQPHDLPNSTGTSCRFKTKKLQRLYQNHKTRHGLF